MRLGDLDALKDVLIKEREAIPLTKTERYSLGVEMPNPHGMSMRGGINKALRCMEKVPTIDAVPVVRCKDRKHWEPVHEHIPHVECNIFCGAYNHGYPTGADDFCSYGERKDGDGNG